MESLTFLRPAWHVLEPDSSPLVSQSSVREKRKGGLKHFPSPPLLPTATTSRVPSPACDSRVQIKATADESVLEPLDDDPIRLETRSRDATASVGPVYSHFFDHHFIYQHWSTRIKSALWPRYANNHITRAMAAMDQWTVKSVHQRPFI